jgi:hypothetical protein
MRVDEALAGRGSVGERGIAGGWGLKHSLWSTKGQFKAKGDFQRLQCATVGFT